MIFFLIASTCLLGWVFSPSTALFVGGISGLVLRSYDKLGWFGYLVSYVALPVGFLFFVLGR